MKRILILLGAISTGSTVFSSGKCDTNSTCKDAFEKVEQGALIDSELKGHIRTVVGIDLIKAVEAYSLAMKRVPSNFAESTIPQYNKDALKNLANLLLGKDTQGEALKVDGVKLKSIKEAAKNKLIDFIITPITGFIAQAKNAELTFRLSAFFKEKDSKDPEDRPGIIPSKLNSDDKKRLRDGLTANLASFRSGTPQHTNITAAIGKLPDAAPATPARRKSV